MLHYGYWIRNVFPLSLMRPVVTVSITRDCRCMPDRHLATNLPCKAQSLLYLPSSLAFENSSICTHNVFMCFIWISEQTAIIFEHSMNSLVCVT
jgi:hypothetical protein